MRVVNRSMTRGGMFLSRYFCITGWVVGIFFFALSLTPTLLPRVDVVQGGISGVSLAVGYGIGVFLRWLWGYLGLPVVRRQWQHNIHAVAALVCIMIAALFLWQANGWQNSVRLLMGMEEADGFRMLVVAGVALSVFLSILLIAKLFRRTVFFLSGRMQSYVSTRISHLLALLLSFFLFWSIIDGIFFSMALRAVDQTYQDFDTLVDSEMSAPEQAHRVGSSASLVHWDEIGRMGRGFLSRTPLAEEIAPYAGELPVREPLRVYIGMNNAPTPAERAELALQELIRTDAFDRSVLLLMTPTGRGWIDPAGILPIEFLHRGDIASVTVQYSYLPSPFALLFEGEYGIETARALFEAVYGHWASLPAGERPDLYLWGLSLGALNSDSSFDFYDIIDDPFQGALWTGPPFRSETWRTVTGRRDRGSPAWLPVFRDGSVVRFINQYSRLNDYAEEWGDFRIAFLQYASDPVTFFSPQAFYREPEWMQAPRGPDVSPDLRWYPIVTGLQLAADLGFGGSPTGYGHEYSAEHYLQAWYHLTEPPGWADDSLQRLQERFAQ